MQRVMCAVAVAVLSSPLLAVQFTGVQTSATTWNYTLTYDPFDNYGTCQNDATITVSGLSGVVAAGAPSATDHPVTPATQLAWTPQVLNGGTTVVWTHHGGGTGNFGIAIHVFGFTITAPGGQNGLAPVATTGFALDGVCPPQTILDIGGTVSGPVAAQSVTRVIPVVGSTAGNQGAVFKTAVQLYNARLNAPITGKIIFHTQGTSGSPNDPSVAYSLNSGKSISYPDLLLAMSVGAGLGSADIVPINNTPLPVVSVRVFNDGGAAGTSGFIEEQFAPSSALQKGSMSVLIAPDDMQKFRLNIGVRTLEQGVTFGITVRDKNGAVVKTTSKTYTPTFFTQVGSAAMLDGYALTGGENITFTITAGSAFIYGATTDNVTNDPAVAFARP